MTLENFIVGESNRAAYSACTSFAASPHGKILVISGSSHCGKSHLAHITENNYRTAFPENKVLMTNCDDFTNEYILSIRKRTDSEFLNTVCDFDLLVIDNFQFVSGKTSTEKMFSCLFSKMLANNKSVVVITDRSPQNLSPVISSLDVVNARVLPQDVSLRREYITGMSRKYSVPLPISVVDYLAESFSISFSALSGCMKKISILAANSETSLTEQQIVDSIIY